MCVITTVSSELVPERVKTTWQHAVEGTFSDLRCLSVAAAVEEAEERVRQEAATQAVWAARPFPPDPHNIWLVGNTPSGKTHEACGEYVRRRDDVNEQPSYVHRGKDELMLWRAGRRWLFGLSRGVGGDVAGIRAASYAAMP